MKTIPETIPQYTFRLKDAAQKTEPRKFTDLLISTGKFRRNERSQIVFAVAKDDWVLVERKQQLTQIIDDGETIIVNGDLGDTCTDCLWMWLTSRKHTLQRHNPEKAWVDPRPAARFENRGRDCAS
jgi:hypothetical protein